MERCLELVQPRKDKGMLQVSEHLLHCWNYQRNKMANCLMVAEQILSLQRQRQPVQQQPLLKFGPVCVGSMTAERTILKSEVRWA